MRTLERKFMEIGQRVEGVLIRLNRIVVADCSDAFIEYARDELLVHLPADIDQKTSWVINRTLTELEHEDFYTDAIYAILERNNKLCLMKRLYCKAQWIKCYVASDGLYHIKPYEEEKEEPVYKHPETFEDMLCIL